MKHLLFRKSFLTLISLLILCSLNAYAQNTYLSFRDGAEEKVDGIETMPKRTYQSLKSNNIEIGYTFTGAYVAETEVEKIPYNFLHIKGFSKMSQIGAPALPAFNDIIAMPRDAVGKIVILESDYYEYDGYMVHPALEPARDTEGAPSPKFQKDNAIYTKDEFFPKNIVEIVNVSLSRGTGLAKAQIRPVQFNPVTGKIRVYTNIKYRMETIGGEKSFDYISKENTLHYTNLLKRNVINSESIPDGLSSDGQKKNKAGAKNYIIVTHSEYLTQAKALANWKRQLGYSVEVISQSGWTAEQVKTEVHDRYNSWTPKPDYFVIIGDHTGSYAVPGEIHQDPSKGEDFATDLYVACMDGAFDHVPDMAHGRISVSSSEEATVVVNKIINYEKTPTTNTAYYNNILNCTQYQDVESTEAADGYAARRFCHTSEEIRDYLQGNYAYTSTRVYYTGTTWNVADLHYNNGYYSDGQLLPEELRNASFNWSGGSSDITSAIDAGKFMIFHRDHGYVGGSGWAHPYYTTASMTSLANGDKLPVIFSMNCHTGEFQLDNCFAEKFVRMEDKGAVGVVAAAYYSYSGYNDALSEGMIDAIWSDPGIRPNFGSAGNGGSYTIGAGNDIYTMGDVVNQGLYAMVQNFNDNTYTHELYHYFGDPAMKIWTANPNDNTITTTHNATIDCAGSSFSVTGSTADAVATLVFNNELIAETTLDGNGDGTLTYSITSPGSPVALTIFKYNHKPYTADLTVTGTCSFPPAVENDVATSVTTSSATLNGEITNDYGSTVTESGFVYSISPEPVISGGGVTQVQTSPTVTTGTFNEDISGLSVNTKYYFKAYAINANGTSYSDELSFTTTCTSPTTQTTDFVASEINYNDITITWISGGDHVLVLAKEGSAVNLDPFNGDTYSANSDFTIGEDIGDGNIAVYSGTDETVTVTNLNEATEYHFAIYKYNDAEMCYNTILPETGNAITSGYCASHAVSSDDSEIDEVIFNTINVNSAGVCASYTDNTAVSTNVEQGQIYSLSLTAGTCGGSYPKAIKAFIDWNGDEDFDDTDELIYTSDMNSSTTTYNANITIPAIYVGSVRMRIVCSENDPSSISSCGTYNWGETEDYTINITSSCTPPATQATNFAAPTINDNDITITWTSGGDHVLVLAKESSAVNSDPFSETTYSANSDFTSGEDIGNGNIVVYSGTDETVTVTNLNEITEYYFAIYKYNDAEMCYNTTSPATGNVTTIDSYCTASGGGYGHIDGVALGTISTSGTGANAYENHTDLSTDLALGETYTLTITNGTSNSNIDLGVWIDFNDNLSFDDPGENVICAVNDGANGDYNLTVPGDAALGAHRMRIRTKYYGDDCGSSCGNTSCGEVEDYTINVVASDLPVVETSVSNLDFGDVETGNTTEQSYTVEGAYLKDNITITAPTGYEISLTTGSGFTNSLTLIQSGGTVVTTTIYVKFAPVSVQTYSGNISHTSTDATQVDVAVTGNGVAPGTPIITKSVTSLNFGDIILNTISTEQSYTISGSNLTSDIVITSPDGFEISLDNSDYSVNPITLTQSGGTVSTTTIYVRFEPVSAISYTSDITHESTGATTANASVTGNGICDNLIVTGPDDQTKCGGETATFTVSVTGTETITYVWKKGTVILSNGGDISGATTNSISITNIEAADEGNYICEVTDACGNTEISTEGILTVPADVNITANPVSLTKCEGEQAQFTVSATGDGLVYQWKKGSANVGTNSSTYTIASVTVSDADDYSCVVSGTCGSPATSNVAVLTVNVSIVSINTQPQDVTACEGSEVTFTITATDAVSYQWQKDGTDISGATSDSYTINSAVTGNAGAYTCIASDDCGSVTSNSAALAVNTSLVAITGQPESATVCEGSEVVFTITATNATSYQWQKDGTDISGATSDSYTINSAVTGNAGAYTCIASDDCGSVTSNSATLAVNTSLVAITGQPESATVCEGSEVTFTITATGATAYQWQKDGTDISGATSDSYTINSAVTGNAGAYTCIASDDCGSVTSNSATLAVNTSSVAITGQPESASVCEGSEVTFTIVATGATAYQWQKDGTDISGAISGTYTISSVATGDAGAYTCIAYDDCGSVTSNSATLAVSTSLVAITGQPESASVCEGSEVTFTIVATGATAYQWQKDGTAISGAITNAYTISSVATGDAGAYTCIAYDDCGSVTSNSATLEISVSTEITQQAVDINANEGEDISFNIVAAGSNLTYQWHFGGANIDGADGDIYQIHSVIEDNAGNYDVVVTGECGEVSSDVAVLSVTTTNIEELTEYGINIYPNPSSGIFNISYNKNIENVEVIIINFEGKIIYKENHNSDNNIIDLSNKTKGVYLIKFNYGGKLLISRIVLI